MKLSTAQQMKNIDKSAIEGMGIPGLKLMEVAGKSVAEVIADYMVEVEDKKVLIFCGKGNNGGDGFVVARYLTEWGAKVDCFLLGKKTEVKGDTNVNLKKALDLNISITEVQSPTELDREMDADLLVDGIFGTGFKGEIGGELGEIVERLNQLEIPKLSIDAPSGLDCDTGEVASNCFRADVTVTLALPKLGQFVFPGKSYCGHTHVADIGIPQKAVEGEEIKLNVLTPSEVASMLPKRPPDGHKGTFGKLAIIAGSVGMTGAATLTSLSALKAGCGMVILGCPSSLNDIFEIKMTEVMTKPLPEVRRKRVLAKRSLGEIRQLLKWADTLALGPGLGQHFETVELVQRLVSTLKHPVVIDADGLNALAKNVDILKNRKTPTIITPHIGELSRLVGLPIEEIERDRIEIARKTASDFGLILVLKGAPTVIAEPGGEVWINPTGNDGMATAGCGDVLTGIIASFLTQGMGPLEAAICGVYIHGLAGDLAAYDRGQFGSIAGDIMEMVPEAIIEMQGAEATASDKIKLLTP
ncbi:MAG: NAD(P)H-hydrate dehydratase [Candidatus Zixiibacteriota bacterium]